MGVRAGCQCGLLVFLLRHDELGGFRFYQVKTGGEYRCEMDVVHTAHPYCQGGQARALEGSNVGEV